MKGADLGCEDVSEYVCEDVGRVLENTESVKETRPHLKLRINLSKKPLIDLHTGCPIKDARLHEHLKPTFSLIHLPYYHRVDQEWFTILRTGVFLGKPCTFLMYYF